MGVHLHLAGGQRGAEVVVAVLGIVAGKGVEAAEHVGPAFAGFAAGVDGDVDEFGLPLDLKNRRIVGDVAAGHAAREDPEAGAGELGVDQAGAALLQALAQDAKDAAIGRSTEQLGLEDNLKGQAVAGKDAAQVEVAPLGDGWRGLGVGERLEGFARSKDGDLATAAGDLLVGDADGRLRRLVDGRGNGAADGHATGRAEG